MLKHKIRILFFRKTSHVYLKLSKYGMVNQFKPIYKIFKRGEGGSTKKIYRIRGPISVNMPKPTIKCS